MNLCQNSSTIDCSISDILNRIKPIEFIDGVLVVSSPVSIESNKLLIGNNEITTSNDVLKLPINTTINQQPLNGLPFTGNTLSLPTYTTIDGYTIATTNYVYFYNMQTRVILKESGNYLVGADVTPNQSSGPKVDITNVQFPFIAPQDCILTSLIFTFVGAVYGNPVTEAYTNVTAYIDTISPSGSISWTGISVNIPICPPKTRYYVEKKFQYSLNKNYAVGIRFTYIAAPFTAFNYGCGQFATLGYKFLPI